MVMLVLLEAMLTHAYQTIIGERATADVQDLGILGHDGAAAARDHLPPRRAPAGLALGQHYGVELSDPRPATRYHDVLPWLRHAAF